MLVDNASHDIVAGVAHLGFIDGPLYGETLLAGRRFGDRLRDDEATFAPFRLPDRHAASDLNLVVDRLLLHPVGDDLLFVVDRLAFQAVVSPQQLRMPLAASTPTNNGGHATASASR